jgi:hypothetical protein
LVAPQARSALSVKNDLARRGSQGPFVWFVWFVVE